MTPKVLIAVKTCHAMRERANCQRQSWVPEVRGADVRFFLGGGEAIVSDEVILSVDDSYAGLPAKTQAICKWAVEQGYDYACLIDDDTYIRVDRLLDAHFERFDYVGRVRCASGDLLKTPAPYCSGFAYVLSYRAMKIFADSELYGDDAEDRFVGNVLLRAGIEPVLDERFRVMLSSRNATCITEPPLPGNRLIAACEFIGPKMLEIHDNWNRNCPSHLKYSPFPEGTLSSVCVQISTLLRDGLLYRCIEGLERFYPEMKIIVVDDGQGSKQKNSFYPALRDRGHVCICLPFDSGFGAKRNAAIPFCDRPYVLIGSDDFDFSHPSVRVGIEKMVKVLDGDPTIHIVSGRVNGKTYEALLEIDGSDVRETPGHRGTRIVNGVTVKMTDLTVNYCMIRRECLGPGKLYWDDDVKIGGGEHGARFVEAKRLGYGVCVIEDAHVREMGWDFSQVNPMYPQLRQRARLPGRPSLKRIGIDRWLLQDGVTWETC